MRIEKVKNPMNENRNYVGYNKETIEESDIVVYGKTMAEVIVKLEEELLC